MNFAIMRLGLFIIIAIILLGGLFYFFSPKPTVEKQPATNAPVSSTPVSKQESKKISLVVQDNILVSGNPVITVIEGDTVTINVTNDTDDELHIHGYEKEIELKKDIPSEITLQATLTGRFILELHESDAEIAVLEVQPK
jgi:FtsP/CotA-like multicopper oxidase with cupredoxin domain